MIRVFLFEDEIIAAKGLEAEINLLECNIQVVGFEQNLQQGILFIKKNPCDVIILDLWLNRNDPLQNFAQLHSELPNIPLIIYSHEKSLYWKWRILQEGACGFIIKDWDVQKLIALIYKVHGGNSELPDDLVKLFNNSNFTKGLYEISSRDLDLLYYKYLHLRNREIATKFDKSIKLVEKNLQVLCDTFGVPTFRELCKLFF